MGDMKEFKVTKVINFRRGEDHMVLILLSGVQFDKTVLVKLSTGEDSTLVKISELELESKV